MIITEDGAQIDLIYDASRGGWQVECSRHGLLGEGRHYATPGIAHGVAARHRNRLHPGGERYSFTRSELIDALRYRKPPAPLGGPVVVLEGDAVFEAMADSIIEALEEQRGREWEGGKG